VNELQVRAISEPRRRRILDALRSRPDGFWTVDEVAAGQSVHRSVAFEQLEALAQAGLVTRRKLAGARGRPANAYRYTGASVELSYPPQEHRLLAELLARSLADSTSGVEAARKVGREFGSEHTDLAALGGQYEVDHGSVHAANCMFGVACATARQVVCGLHAGLIEGAFNATGRTCKVTPLGPDGTGGCRFELT
jgi:predicted ArsR family transcriptional regulator